MKKAAILFVLDERLSRERHHLLMRHVNSLRRLGAVEVLDGSIDEERLIQLIQAHDVKLAFVPWYRYLSWRRLDGHFGPHRTAGPTVAGYFADNMTPADLGPQSDHLRTILFDFTHLHTREIYALVRALFDESLRSGVEPFLKPKTSTIYHESWHFAQGLGFRLDTVTGLIELTRHDWQPRSSAIRMAMSSLWSLVYEEGPGKTELANHTESKLPRAHFEVAVDEGVLLLRLCYPRRSWSPRDAANEFWPDASRPSRSSQVLLRHADFTRVHWYADAGWVEVVAGFFPSAVAEKCYGQLHTLWVEPLTEKLFAENPALDHTSLSPIYQPLPAVPQAHSRVTQLESTIRSKEKMLYEAAARIKELRAQIRDRDDKILEFRRGGVGVAPTQPPPRPSTASAPQIPTIDTQQILAQVQARYQEVQAQLARLEDALARAEERGVASQVQIELIRRRAEVLTERESAFLDHMSRLLAQYKPTYKKSG